MTTVETLATEYRDLPLALLTESTTNPRRYFDGAFLKELAASMRIHGVLSPLLVRPKGEVFEIVFGAQRFRAAMMAKVPAVPVGIREMTDAEVLEAQLVENLQRRDVHPLEEAQGFRTLLHLEEPKYSIEQIAAKTGKSPAYVVTRLKLTDLIEEAVEAFSREEIGIGHALLLAKLPADRQAEALAACFREDWSATRESETKHFLLPVRHLEAWIEQHVLLILLEAPFDMRDGGLVPAAGSCRDCAKRTGHNKLLFSDLGKEDACTDVVCFQAKVDAHIAKALAANPKLVQISTGYGRPKEGTPILSRRQYVPVHDEKPKSKESAQRPEFKTCRFTTEAIVAEGEGKGTTHKVCPNLECPVHHPKPEVSKADVSLKAKQDKERREEAIAQATSLRVLRAVSDAVPVRLMKRDIGFLVEQLAELLDESRLDIVARHHQIKREKENEPLSKALNAYLRHADEGVLGSILVELTILLSSSRQQARQVLKDAAQLYKVDVEAITAKVRQEFAVKEKAKTERKAASKQKQVKPSAAAKRAAA